MFGSGTVDPAGRTATRVHHMVEQTLKRKGQNRLTACCGSGTKLPIVAGALSGPIDCMPSNQNAES